MYQLRTMKNNLLSASKGSQAPPTVQNGNSTEEEVDDMQMLLQKIEILKKELKDSHKREETLKGVNQTLKDVIAKMQAEHQQMSPQTSSKFLIQDSLPKNPSSQGSSTEFSDIASYYESKIANLKEQFDVQKQKLEDNYLSKIEQTRQELQAQAKDSLNRQLHLMQDEIRVHFEREKVKAEHYLRNLFVNGVPSPQNTTQMFTSSPNSESNCIFRTDLQMNSTSSSTLPVCSVVSNRSNARQLPRDMLTNPPTSKQPHKSSPVQISLYPHNITASLQSSVCSIQPPKTHTVSQTPTCSRVQIEHKSYYHPMSYKNSQIIDLNNSAYENCCHSEESPQKRKLLTEEADDVDFELLQGLLRKKEETEFKIETLRYSKNPDHRQEKERLQVDLEQLVQIIQKKRRFGDFSRIRKVFKDRIIDKNGSYCDSLSNSIGKTSKTEDISRIYLEDRPASKKSCHKENQNINRSVTSSFIKSGTKSPTTCTATNRRFLKRFLC